MLCDEHSFCQNFLFGENLDSELGKPTLKICIWTQLQELQSKPIRVCLAFLGVAGKTSWLVFC